MQLFQIILLFQNLNPLPIFLTIDFARVFRVHFIDSLVRAYVSIAAESIASALI